MAPTDGGETADARFERLLQTNQAVLRRMTAGYARTPEDREDLIQEIAIAVWRSLPGFRGECAERTFVLRIAHNRCLTYAKSKRRDVSLEAHVAEPLDTRVLPEQQVVHEQQTQHLLDAVRALPLIYREIVLLTLEGLDYREISEVVGISESNVGARLSRARQHLRKALEEELEQRC